MIIIFHLMEFTKINLHSWIHKHNIILSSIVNSNSFIFQIKIFFYCYKVEERLVILLYSLLKKKKTIQFYVYF